MINTQLDPAKLPQFGTCDILLFPGSMIAVPNALRSPEVVKTQKIDGGYISFRKEIEEGEVGIFHWFSDFGKLEKYNPLLPLSAYLNDRERVSTPGLQMQVLDQLNQAQPRILVAHSKGCQLLLETFIRYGFPPSVKIVIFIQSDDDADKIEAIDKLADSVKMYNVYAKDDLTLISSVALNGGKIRAGLVPSSNTQVINIPYKSGGIHIASLKDTKLKKWILSL
jgi:hypothetical protein